MAGIRTSIVRDEKGGSWTTSSSPSIRPWRSCAAYRADVLTLLRPWIRLAYAFGGGGWLRHKSRPRPLTRGGTRARDSRAGYCRRSAPHDSQLDGRRTRRATHVCPHPRMSGAPSAADTGPWRGLSLPQSLGRGTGTLVLQWREHGRLP